MQASRQRGETRNEAAQALMCMGYIMTESRGVTRKGAGAQWAHHCGVNQMRFLLLTSYGLSLSGEIISTQMNVDNWPLNCHRNIKHLFRFFIFCSGKCSINPKDVPEHSQSVKFQRFFADENQPYLKI